VTVTVTSVYGVTFTNLKHSLMIIEKFVTPLCEFIIIYLYKTQKD
jgi:hypothetical protein